MLRPHEREVAFLSVDEFWISANFSQIVPHYANRAALVCMLTHLRHAFRFGHRPTAICRSTGSAAAAHADILRRQLQIWKADPEADRRKRANRFRAIPLLDGVRTTAAGAGRPALALLEFEGQHVEQAIDTIRERLQQGLLLERRDIEMKAQKVD